MAESLVGGMDSGDSVSGRSQGTRTIYSARTGSSYGTNGTNYTGTSNSTRLARKDDNNVLRSKNGNEPDNELGLGFTKVITQKSFIDKFLSVVTFGLRKGEKEKNSKKVHIDSGDANSYDENSSYVASVTASVDSTSSPVSGVGIDQKSGRRKIIEWEEPIALDTDSPESDQ